MDVTVPTEVATKIYLDSLNCHCSPVARDSVKRVRVNDQLCSRRVLSGGKGAARRRTIASRVINQRYIRTPQNSCAVRMRSPGAEIKECWSVICNVVTVIEINIWTLTL